MARAPKHRFAGLANSGCGAQAFHTVLKMTQTMLEEKNWGVLTQAMGALQQMFGAVQR